MCEQMYQWQKSSRAFFIISGNSFVFFQTKLNCSPERNERETDTLKVNMRHYNHQNNNTGILMQSLIKHTWKPPTKKKKDGGHTRIPHDHLFHSLEAKTTKVQSSFSLNQSQLKGSKLLQTESDARPINKCFWSIYRISWHFFYLVVNLQ